MKLAAFLAAHALATPDRLAVSCGSQRLTFRELDETSTRLACGLAARGVSVGDRVALLLSNRAEFVVAFIGIVKAGAIAVCLNPRLSGPEVAYILADADPGMAIYESATRDTIVKSGWRGLGRVCVDGPEGGAEIAFATLTAPGQGRLPDIPPEFDDCQISYTSGTTGKPKGAVMTQANFIVTSGFMNAQQWGMSSRDRVLVTTPLAHRTAFARLMNVYCLGASIVILPRFDAAEAARLIHAEGVTVLGIVPTVGRMLLPEIEADPAKFRSLRIAIVSGEAFPAEVKERLLRALPDLGVYSFFAMTEVGPVTCLGPAEQALKPGSAGRVNPGVEVKLVDGTGAEVPPGEAGEILVRSGAPGSFLVMRAYFNNPAASAEALAGGWLHTGDLGRFDPDGYLYIVDRKKDMVLSGGYNIYSKEVEAAILELGAVSDVAVVGVPDAIYGEAVAAFVELRPGAAADAQSIIEHCRARIASYKKPKHVRFVPSLPRNGMGKVLKYELREEFARSVK
jgi:long-chain acyl-CoA synthetase